MKAGQGEISTRIAGKGQRRAVSSRGWGQTWDRRRSGAAGRPGLETGVFRLCLEAVRPSTVIGDQLITVEADPDGWPAGGQFQTIAADALRANPLKANLGFNNNNSPESDPNNTLRDGTPDVGFIIDAADDRTEEQEDGFGFWWSRDTGSVAFEARDLTDLIPLVIDVPQQIIDLGLVVSMRMEFVGTGPATVYLYRSLSPSNDRTKFLSDPQIAAQQIAASAQPGNVYTLTNDDEAGFDFQQPGKHEFLMRVVGSGAIGRINLVLFWNEFASAEFEVVLDRAVVTVRDAAEFYTLASARGTAQAPISEPNVPFLYRSEGGRTEWINVFPYEVVRDRHDEDVKTTLVYVHGFNVDYQDADRQFNEVHKRLYWQGFRGNFVGFSWRGDQGIATTFDKNVENALYTSGSLWLFLRNVLQNDASAGGWGLPPEDVNIAAHSLGNLVMWDAIRLNGRIAQNERLANNVASIEAALWSEAFDPWGPVVYTGNHQITYTPTQLERMSWNHWFNPGDMNIKDSLLGKVFNSHYADDEILLRAMRSNDLLERAPWHFSRPEVSFRTASNLWFKPALMLQGMREPSYTVSAISLPIGVVPMPIADRNVNAGAYGWDNTDGWHPIPGLGDNGHSDFTAEPYPDTYAWWRHLFAGDGDASWAAVPMGKEH